MTLANVAKNIQECVHQRGPSTSHGPTEWAWMSTFDGNLEIFAKVTFGPISITNDGPIGWLVPWALIDLRPIGRGLIGRATVLLPHFKLLKLF